MKSILPNPDSILAFLQFKGWALARKDKGHYILRPPDGLMEDPDYLLWVPHLERQEVMYKTIVTAIMKDIATLYDWDFTDLSLLLAKNPDELEKIFKKAIREETKAENAKTALALAS